MNHLNDLTIYLTEKCNFSCSYCYYNKDLKSSLSIEKIKSSLDIFFEKYADKSKPIYITLLGGEPLVEKKLMYQTLDLIKGWKKKAKIKVYLFTNGSLLSRKDAEELLKRNVKIYLSIDGVKESNDRYRKCKGSSAFSQAMKNIRKFPKPLIKKMGVNMVVGKKNCSYLMRNIKFFSKMGLGSIELSLMSYENWPKKSLKKLVEQLDELYVYYNSLFSGKNKQKFRMYQLGELFHGGWDKMDNCTRVKLAPDGNFYFCDAFFSLDSMKRETHKLDNMEKIDALKEEAKQGISKVFPKTFSMHEQNRMIYCPYGVYYYCKQNHKDLKTYLKNFYISSRIYSSFMVHLFEDLRNNKEFLQFYSSQK